MKTDIKFMQGNIMQLQDKTTDSIINKFGMLIDLDELEESILKRFLYDIRANITDMNKHFEEKKLQLMVNRNICII